MENGTQMTCEQSERQKCHTQTAGASDSHAKTSAWPESSLDSKETDQAFFSKLCDSLMSGKRVDLSRPDTFSLRTLKTFLASHEDSISPKSSLRWMKEGTMQNGVCSTRKSLEYHRIGNDVSLSDILEENVPKQYFLSAEQMQRIVWTSSGTEKGIEETPKYSTAEELRKHLTPDPAAEEDTTQESRPSVQTERERSQTELMYTTQEELGGALRATDYKDPKRVAIPIGNTNPSGNGINGVVYSNGAVNPTITTNKGEGNKIAIPVLTPDRIEKRQNGRRMKENGDPSFTLTGQDRHGVAIGIEKSVGGQETECIELSDGQRRQRCVESTRTGNGGVISIGRLNSSQDGIIFDAGGIAPTHTSGHGNTHKVIIHAEDIEDSTV